LTDVVVVVPFTLLTRLPEIRVPETPDSTGTEVEIHEENEG
jgi:hypothetical protein